MRILAHLEPLTTESSATHGRESSRKLGISLLDVELGAGGFGVADGIDDFGFRACKFAGAFEIFQGLGDLALLEEELGEGCDGDVAFGVD